MENTNTNTNAGSTFLVEVVNKKGAVVASFGSLEALIGGLKAQVIKPTMRVRFNGKTRKLGDILPELNITPWMYQEAEVVEENEISSKDLVEPAMESIAETVVEPAMESIAETVVEPAMESIAETVVEPAMESIAETVVEPAPVPANKKQCNNFKGFANKAFKIVLGVTLLILLYIVVCDYSYIRFLENHIESKDKAYVVAVQNIADKHAAELATAHRNNEQLAAELSAARNNSQQLNDSFLAEQKAKDELQQQLQLQKERGFWEKVKDLF